jgi:TetR/AcrR family transcriptional regulator, mexJK operon transcriptional repressor
MAPRRPARADTSTQGRTEGRSARKREAILEAAAAAFLADGYRGTSVDAIAAAAGVSKQTVYKHFADKERLFSEIVIETVNGAAEPVHEAVLGLEESEDVAKDLRALARRQLKMVMEPELLRLRRLVIAEAARFPELGRAFYERGPARTIAALAAAFERLAERGALQIEDPKLAAAHFNWLVMSIPLNQAMLLGEDEPASAVTLNRYADAGTRAFLAAYGGPDPGEGPARAKAARR